MPVKISGAYCRITDWFPSHIIFRNRVFLNVGGFMKCEICDLVFERRPNRRYCSIKCRRAAEGKERKRKKEERRKAWLASLSPEDRALWGSFPEVNIGDFQTPEQQKAWEDELANLPTLSEIMTENMPKK